MRLRLLRRQQGMTLEALAERAGLTKSYLSKLERGLSTPSISLALKLAAALDVDVETLFGEGDGSRDLVTVVRAKQRTQIGGTNEPGGSRYEGISTGTPGNQMVPFVLYPPDVDDVSTPFREHDGQEFVFVHQGRAELQLPSRTVTLSPGDAAYFEGTLPHRLRSVGKKAAAVLLVISRQLDADHAIPSHH